MVERKTRISLLKVHGTASNDRHEVTSMPKNKADHVMHNTTIEQQPRILNYPLLFDPKRLKLRGQIKNNNNMP